MFAEILLIIPSQIDCQEKWHEVNSGEAISKQEFQICKGEFKNNFISEYKKEYYNYLGNDTYCSDKWIEIHYRRNPTIAENSLCKNEFKKYRQKEISWKKELLQKRGIY